MCGCVGGFGGLAVSIPGHIRSAVVRLLDSDPSCLCLVILDSSMTSLLSCDLILYAVLFEGLDSEVESGLATPTCI